MRVHDTENGFDDAAHLSPNKTEDNAALGASRALESGQHEAMAPTSVMHLQRAAGNESVSGLMEEERSPVLDIVGKGGGDSLEPDVRDDMESRLGQDFSDVRVHTGAAAAESARAVNAHAYTAGNDVVFADGQYSPGSDSGRKTLAHELTHVVQQRSGPVDATPAGGGIALSDPSDAFERQAEHSAEQAMSPAPTATRAASGPAVQREEAAPEDDLQEEQPIVQGVFVQREESEEKLQEDE